MDTSEPNMITPYVAAAVRCVPAAARDPHLLARRRTVAVPRHAATLWQRDVSGGGAAAAKVRAKVAVAAPVAMAVEARCRNGVPRGELRSEYESPVALLARDFAVEGAR